jgi:hypothetical protein
MTHRPTSPASALRARAGLAARSHVLVRPRLLIGTFPVLFSTKSRVLSPHFQKMRTYGEEEP